MKISTLFFVVTLTISTTVPASATIPFYTSFSQEEGYFAGSVPGGGWIVAPQTTVIATEHSVESGQSVLLYQGRPPGFVKRGFATEGSDTVFVDLFVRPTAGQAVNESTLIQFDSLGVAFVQHGDEATITVTDLSAERRIEWIDLGHRISTDVLHRGEEWIRVTLRLDYGTDSDRGRYDVYVDGTLARYDLAFQPRRFSSERTLIITGAHGAESWVDDVYFGEDNPVFEDAGTGISKSWLLESGFIPEIGARYAEYGDGRTAIEAFLEENRPDSVNTETRGEILEKGKEAPERRLTVFTRLEQPDPKVQALIEDLTE